MGRRRAPGGGRKRLPTAIHLLRNNAGRRNRDAEVALEQRVEKGVPEPPGFLDALERRRWFEIGRDLDRLGVLAKTDGGTLALMVVARVRWERATAKLRKEGEVLERDNPSGGATKYRNPIAIAAEKAWQQYRAMLMECGLSPASRAKIAPLVPSAGAPRTGNAAAAAGGGDPYFPA